MSINTVGKYVVDVGEILTVKSKYIRKKEKDRNEISLDSLTAYTITCTHLLRR